MLARYKPSGRSKKATMDAIRAQRSAQSQAAYMIKRNPILRGNARTSSNWSGNYRYGRSSAELKFFDTAFNTTTPIAGTVGQLVTIPQDATQSGRVGKKIVVKAIVCNMTFRINGTGAAGTAGNDRIRVVLVLDKQANGAACDWSSVGNGVFATTGPDALRNLDNSHRFRVIKDWDVSMNATAGVSGAWQFNSKSFNYYTKCFIPIEYDNSVATGAIGSIRSNNLCILVCGLAADNCNVSGTVRVRYTDN